MYALGFISGMVLTSLLWMLCELAEGWWENRQKRPRWVNYEAFQEELGKHVN